MPRGFAMTRREGRAPESIFSLPFFFLYFIFFFFSLFFERLVITGKHISYDISREHKGEREREKGVLVLLCSYIYIYIVVEGKHFHISVACRYVLKS